MHGTWVGAVKKPAATYWRALDHHFTHHAKLVARFKSADAEAVLGMWKRQTNEEGNPLSQFEREALAERYSELFGIWPD